MCCQKISKKRSYGWCLQKNFLDQTLFIKKVSRGQIFANGYFTDFRGDSISREIKSAKFNHIKVSRLCGGLGVKKYLFSDRITNILRGLEFITCKTWIVFL